MPSTPFFLASEDEKEGCRGQGLERIERKRGGDEPVNYPSIMTGKKPMGI
jgi:hypothetical protein